MSQKRRQNRHKVAEPKDPVSPRSNEGRRSNRLTRTLLIGLLAVGGVVTEEATVGLARKGIIHLLQDGNRAEIEKSIQPYIQPSLDVLNPEIEEIVKRKQLVFPDTTLHINETEDGIKTFQGFPSDTPQQKVTIQEVSKMILESGIIQNLKSLRLLNENRKIKADLVLIPQRHWHSLESEGGNEQSKLCADDIRNIVNTYKELDPAIFPEGMRMEGRLTHDSFIRSIGLDRRATTPQELEAFRRNLTNVFEQDGQGWLLDPTFRVLGAEHPIFMNFNEEIMHQIGASNNAVMGNYSLYYMDVVNGLIREQYMTEKALSQMKGGGTGIIIMGASHIPTMERYIKERYPQIRSKVVIPRHLF